MVDKTFQVMAGSFRVNFRIHQFPTTAETLLLAFLPHHSDPLYIRLLQIVSLPSNFAFLGQYTDVRASASLPPVPRQLIVRALSRDPGFVETYFSFVVARIKRGHGYSSMIVKWSTLTIETILQMRQARVKDEDPHERRREVTQDRDSPLPVSIPALLECLCHQMVSA